MKKMTLKGKVTLCSILTASFIAGNFTLTNKDESVSKEAKGLYEVLEKIDSEYEYNKILELDTSYDDFVEIGNNVYACNQDFTEYYETEVSTIAQNIINNSQLNLDIDDLKGFDKEYKICLENAIENAWDNCPVSKKDSFYHILKELRIYDLPNDLNSSAYASYSSKEKNIKLYSGTIKESIEQEQKYYHFGEDFAFNQYVYMLEHVLTHELNHAIEDTCICNKEKSSMCFDNNTLCEALAEENTDDPSTYSFERSLFNLIKFSGIFNEEEKLSSLDEILFSNDLDKLYKFFGAKTKEEKYEIYQLFASINLIPSSSIETLELYGETYYDKNVTAYSIRKSLYGDINVTLLKYYCKNLINFSEKNNISLEDNIYFFKVYLEQLLNKNMMGDNDYKSLDNYMTIIDAYSCYLENYYGVSEDKIKERLIKIDIYTETKENNKIGVIPFNVLNKIGQEKTKFIEEQLFKKCEQFTSIANYSDSSFNLSNSSNLIKMLNSQPDKTYKKEK